MLKDTGEYNSLIQDFFYNGQIVFSLQSALQVDFFGEKYISQPVLVGKKQKTTTNSFVFSS